MDDLSTTFQTIGLPPAESSLHEQALEAAREFKRSEAGLMEALIAVDQARVFARMGYGSLFQYAVEALGLSEATAYNALTVARKAAQIPELRQAVSKGLGLSKARKVLSVIENDPENWTKLAVNLSSRQLEKAVARENPRAATFERATYTSGNRLELILGVSEELLLKLRRTQDLVSRSQGRSVSLEETLAALTDLYLHQKDPETKAKRVIAKKGHRPSSAGNCSREQPVAPMRTPVPIHILHQVRLRDRNRCQMPGCHSSRFIDIHHIRPIAQGGGHSVENLITLCKTHHQEAHRPPPDLAQTDKNRFPDHFLATLPGRSPLRARSA